MTSSGMTSAPSQHRVVTTEVGDCLELTYVEVLHGHSISYGSSHSNGSSLGLSRTNNPILILRSVMFGSYHGGAPLAEDGQKTPLSKHSPSLNAKFLNTASHPMGHQDLPDSIPVGHLGLCAGMKSKFQLRYRPNRLRFLGAVAQLVRASDS